MIKTVFGGALLLLWLGSCGGRIMQGGPDESQDTPPSTAPTTPTPKTAPTANPTTPQSTICAWDAPFSSILPVPGISQPSAPAGGNVADDVPRLTKDELTISFARMVTAADDSWTTSILTARRGGRSDPFGVAIAAPLAGKPWASSISSDGLRLFFMGCPTAAATGICVSSRENTLLDFSSGSTLGLQLPFQAGGYPFVSADGETLWFVAETQDQKADGVYSARKVGDDFTDPLAIDEINVADVTSLPTVSADNLTIYTSHASYTGSTGNADIFVSHRATTADRFSTPTALSQINTQFVELPGWLSADNCRLYFSQSKSSVRSQTLYVAERTPQK